MNEDELNQGGNQNMDQDQNNNQVPNTINTPTPSETQNLDVLLQDPKLQAEFDKKLEKAMNKAIRAKEQEYQKQTAALQVKDWSQGWEHIVLQKISVPTAYEQTLHTV